MFRLWGKTFLHNRMTNDLVVCNDSEESRTTKIFQAVTEICQTFDLSEPIWLDINIRDFKRHSKTRFTQDNFIDSIDIPEQLRSCTILPTRHYLRKRPNRSLKDLRRVRSVSLVLSM